MRGQRIRNLNASGLKLTQNLEVSFPNVMKNLSNVACIETFIIFFVILILIF